MRRLALKALSGVVLGFLFLLPFFGWIAADPAPYHDPGGNFSVLMPEGWTADDSGHAGRGVVMKGPAGPGGSQPALQLTYEPAGIVSLDEMWYAHLGRLRYDLSRVNIVTMENREEDSPPHYQAVYTWQEGDVTRKALSRMTFFDDRFYLMTASSVEGDFDALRPLFENVLGSLKPGKK